MTDIEGTAPSSGTLVAGLDSGGPEEMRRIGHEVSFGPAEVFFDPISPFPRPPLALLGATPLVRGPF